MRNNFFKQELLQHLINECGYEASIVNNASPHDLIRFYLEAEKYNIDADTVIFLVNGAFNAHHETKNL
uniref:Uncharacterized protein n=1 Tax=Geladintestivirus 1 TaxID=3233133 RepID=A0AAU8MII3_9CAUD